MKFKFSKQNIFIIFLVIITISLLVFNIVQLSKYSIKEESLPPKNEPIGNISEIIECFNNTNSRQKCLDNFIREYFLDKSTKEVLADLEAARISSLGVENNCHPIAHAVGRVTYEKISNVGDAFEACDQSCHSGCYHGVMERLFYNDDEISTKSHLTFSDMVDKIPGICSSDKFKNPTNSVIFQCLHGVGHAILYSLDYKLEDSLKSCDLLSTYYEQSSCYGGVIMENITSFDKKKRDIDPQDPLYPCNKLDQKYKSDCYTMQTSLMFEYGMTISEIEESCKKAEGFEIQCFTSLGRDLSNYARAGNIEYVTEACENNSEGYEINCVNGTIYALIDNTWDPRFAYPFCLNLKKETLKSACYKNANGYLRWSYGKSKDEIIQSCELYVKEESSKCSEYIY